MTNTVLLNLHDLPSGKISEAINAFSHTLSQEIIFCHKLLDTDIRQTVIKNKYYLLYFNNTGIPLNTVSFVNQSDRLPFEAFSRGNYDD